MNDERRVHMTEDRERTDKREASHIKGQEFWEPLDLEHEIPHGIQEMLDWVKGSSTVRGQKLEEEIAWLRRIAVEARIYLKRMGAKWINHKLHLPFYLKGGRCEYMLLDEWKKKRQEAAEEGIEITIDEGKQSGQTTDTHKKAESGCPPPKPETSEPESTTRSGDTGGKW